MPRRRVTHQGGSRSRSRGGSRRWLKVPRPRLGRTQGFWGALAALLYLAAVTVQLTGAIVLSVISLGVAVVTAFAPAGSVLGSTQGKTRPARSRTENRRASSDPRIAAKLGQNPGKPRKNAPSARRSSTAPKRSSKPKACSVACRNSDGYVEDCDCSCQGGSHGTERAGGPRRRPRQVTRDQLRGKRYRQAERAHVKRNESYSGRRRG